MSQQKRRKKPRGGNTSPPDPANTGATQRLVPPGGPAYTDATSRLRPPSQVESLLPQLLRDGYQWHNVQENEQPFLDVYDELFLAYEAGLKPQVDICLLRITYLLRKDMIERLGSYVDNAFGLKTSYFYASTFTTEVWLNTIRGHMVEGKKDIGLYSTKEHVGKMPRIVLELIPWITGFVPPPDNIWIAFWWREGLLSLFHNSGKHIYMLVAHYGFWFASFYSWEDT